MAEPGDVLERRENRQGRFGWLSPFVLFIVLLSSLPSVEPPRSRQIGSAFDPASASVSVKPQKRQLREPAIVANADPDSSSPTEATSIALWLSRAAFASAPTVQPAALPVRPVMRRVIGSEGPRPPPLH